MVSKIDTFCFNRKCSPFKLICILACLCEETLIWPLQLEFSAQLSPASPLNFLSDNSHNFLFTVFCRQYNTGQFAAPISSLHSQTIPPSRHFATPLQIINFGYLLLLPGFHKGTIPSPHGIWFRYDHFPPPKVWCAASCCITVTLTMMALYQVLFLLQQPLRYESYFSRNIWVTKGAYLPNMSKSGYDMSHLSPFGGINRAIEGGGRRSPLPQPKTSTLTFITELWASSLSLSDT